MVLLAPFIDLLFPPACVACDRVLPAPAAFCTDCEALTLELPTVHCTRCGEPGRYFHRLCPRCTRGLPEFVRAFAPFEHEGALARAIHRFKYEERADLAGPLATLLAQRSRAFLRDAPRLVCPLPLHRSRYRERRYDQASLLAVALARQTSRTLVDGWLTRVRATERQVGLTDEQREANVRGAFEASPDARGHRVLLIDDVLTTGATAREATRSLLRAGAHQVQVLTLARARRQLAH